MTWQKIDVVPINVATLVGLLPAVYELCQDAPAPLTEKFIILGTSIIVATQTLHLTEPSLRQVNIYTRSCRKYSGTEVIIKG